MADFDRTRNKRGIIIAAVVAVVAIVIGNLLPPLAVFTMKLLPHGAHTNLRLVADEALVLNLWSVSDSKLGTQPAPELPPEFEHAENPAVYCAELPTHGCTHVRGPAELNQAITTSAADKFLETNVDSRTRITIGDKPYAEVEDHHRLNRDSAYPVTDPVATKVFTIFPLDTSVEVPPHTLEGLQFYFPFETERRSYQYADPLVWDIVPLDYVDPVDVNGVRTYEFHAEIPVTSLDNSTMQNVVDVTEGLAEQFFSPEEMQRFGYAQGQKVTVQPYYVSDYTFSIEPKTGTVLDQQIKVNVFLAENNVQAQQIIDEGYTNPIRTVFRANFAFDDATKQAQTAVAAPQMAQIRALQVVSWLANVITIIALIVLAWLFLRRRTHLAAGSPSAAR